MSFFQLWTDLIYLMVPVFPLITREWVSAPVLVYFTPKRKTPPEMPVAAKKIITFYKIIDSKNRIQVYSSLFHCLDFIFLLGIEFGQHLTKPIALIAHAEITPSGVPPVPIKWYRLGCGINGHKRACNVSVCVKLDSRTCFSYLINELLVSWFVKDKNHKILNILADCACYPCQIVLYRSINISDILCFRRYNEFFI